MIYDNRRSLIVKWIVESIILSILFSSPILFIYEYEIINGIIIFLIAIILFFLFFYFFSYLLFYKKKHRVMKIENGIFIYSSNKVHHDVNISSFEKVTIYKKGRGKISYSFRLDDGNIITTDDISDKSTVVLKDMKLYDIEKIDLRVPFSKKITVFFKTLISLIKEYHKEIAFILIGLVISIISLILYTKYKDNLYMVISLIIISFTYGIFHTYKLYIKRIYKDDSKLARTILTIILAFIFHLIVFILNLVIFMLILKRNFSIEYLYYTVFLYPSITIVALLVVMILAVLG